MTSGRKWLLAVIGLSIGLAVTGCGKEEEDTQPQVTVEPIPTAESIPEQEEEPEDEPASTEREVVDGKMQSYLTGEWKDEAVVNRRPIAVMVPNNAPALPQYGISRASIIYEAPVEGRITRLMPVFEDFDDLERIGPVRSSRDYYIYIAMGYEAIYCNWGLAVPYVEELINRDTVQNISAAVQGIHNPADEAFGRVSRPGKAKEFTGYLFIDGMKKAAERLGYDWEYDDDHVAPFTFAPEGTKAQDNYAGEPDATMIYPGGQSGNQSGYGSYNPYFEYHEDEGVYYRYQDGSAQVDELDGSQLKVSNVILHSFPTRRSSDLCSRRWKGNRLYRRKSH